MSFFPSLYTVSSLKSDVVTIVVNIKKNALVITYDFGKLEIRSGKYILTASVDGVHRKAECIYKFDVGLLRI